VYITNSNQRASTVLEQALKGAGLESLLPILNTNVKEEVSSKVQKNKKETKPNTAIIPNSNSTSNLVDLPKPETVVLKDQTNSMKSVHKYVNRSIIKYLDESFIGQNVRLGGWQKTSREQGSDKGRFLFLMLNDGSTPKNIQIVVDNNVPGFEEARKALTGSSFLIEGTVIKSPAKGQKIEVQATSVQLLCNTDEKYPLGGKGVVALETLRSMPHLRPRTELFGSIARVRNSLAQATHEFFHSSGFL